MPPAKNRVAQDDSSTSSKQIGSMNHSTIGRAKRQAAVAQSNARANKDTTTVDDAAAQAAQASTTGLSWTSEDLSLLQSYRAAHKMDTPSAFKSQLHQFLLTSGIGRHSPTMARKRSQRKVGKDQLALAVRKNFNGAAVNEVNVMVDLLYKVRNQDKAFRMRSNPAKSK